MIYYLYDFYLRPYFREKAQNVIEYALILAIVVGIGYLIYSQGGLQQDIKTIFVKAKNMIPATAYMPPYNP